MQIRVYDDPSSFWAEVSPHLKKDQAKNNLCLGVAHMFLSDPGSRLYQAALFNSKEFLAAIVGASYFTNRNLLPSSLANVEHAKYLFDAVKQTGLEFNNLIGETQTANMYRQLFHEMGCKTKTHMTQGIYRCARLKLPKVPDDLKFRIAETKDVDTIGKWLEEFHHEAVPHDPPIRGQEVAKDKINKGMVYVIERAGELLATAAWSRDLGTSCSVNMVFTPPSLRGNGYGSIVTGLLTEHFLKQGKKETNLYTDLKNPTSNKIYQQLGYEFVCDSVHFGIERV